MDKNSFYTIGLMSGTSLDGLDIVYAYFLKKDEYWFYEILDYDTVDYDTPLKQKLKTAHLATGQGLMELHNEYGSFIGKCVASFIRRNGIKNVDFIASHGHTVFHQPESKLNFQLGNPYFILYETRIPVIADFRSRNIVFGGQGAPLVPIGDRLLFGTYGIRINLGGFSNFSLENDDGETLAGDICPVNTVINYLTGKYFGKDMDKDGEYGNKGNIQNDMLEELNELEFYRKGNYGSLSREWLEKEFMPVIEKYGNYSPVDILRTVYEHIAIQIANLAVRYNAKENILLTGGGTKNKFLTYLIKEKLKGKKVEIPGNTLIDYKEALIFAFLGVLSFCNLYNCYSSYTQAPENMICGIWYK
jgi:anhydro-N-acetylmuramic acid kinase